MPSLPESDRQALLRLARTSIETAVRHNRLPEEIPQGGVFSLRCGVFVTLHSGKKLRGCIGVIEGANPLGESVIRCAVSAAREDPRFSQVKGGELNNLTIEISLLSPLQRIPAGQIEIGRHGLVVQRGQRRGLLLPQVAVEHGLSRERFLEETCRKAGLAPDSWKDPDTEVYAFTCEIMSEQEPAAAGN